MNDGYSTDRSSVSVHVTSDKDDVDLTVQNVTKGWNVELQQVIMHLWARAPEAYSSCRVCVRVCVPMCVCVTLFCRFLDKG